MPRTRLPNAERAIVDEARARDYLLSPDLPVGWAKARFFAGLGFARDDRPRLRDALLAVGRAGDAEVGEVTAFGHKDVVRDIVHGPTGRAAALLTAWIVRHGEDAPRLVSAHPGEALRRPITRRWCLATCGRSGMTSCWQSVRPRSREAPPNTQLLLRDGIGLLAQRLGEDLDRDGRVG